MRRAVLLYNPNSGRHHNRTALIESIAATLRTHSLEAQTIPTQGPNTAGHQAAQIQTDILFACGGDGTIHEILQGLAFHPHTALGIIPLGSANVLARHLNLSLDPIQAALQQLTYQPQTIPLGQITYTTRDGERTRYFLTMAGAGPDGALVYNMLATNKHRLGRLTYYLRSANLFLLHRFSPFTVTTPTETIRAVSAMAIRVADLGGLFSPLARGASIDDPHILLTTVSTPAPVSLPAWFALSWARLHRLNPWVRTHRVDTFTCSIGETHPIQVQADGEHLGQTPMTITLIPNALRLLMPT
jgi:diacylglycerol kinase (ATP)